MRLDINDPSTREMLKNRVDKLTGQKVLNLPMEDGLSKKTNIVLDKQYKKQKYGNTIFRENGILWRSKWEYQCYNELKLLESQKQIQDLKLQVKYDLVVNGIKIGRYDVDFQFICKGKEILMDAKSRGTERQVKLKYQLKLLKALYDKDVIMVYKGENTCFSCLQSL